MVGVGLAELLLLLALGGGSMGHSHPVAWLATSLIGSNGLMAASALLGFAAYDQGTLSGPVAVTAMPVPLAPPPPPPPPPPYHNP